MTRRIIVSLLVGVLLLGFAAPFQAVADTCTFTATSGVWNSAGNWSCSGSEDIPDSDDLVVIPSGKTCAVDADEDARSLLSVQGTLNVEAGNTLSLHGSAGTASAAVQGDGVVNLEGSGSVLAFLVDGIFVSEGSPGKVVGANDNAKILLENATTLTNNVNIEGRLQITEDAGDDATFHNQGTVHANAAGTLYINTDVISDTSGFRWKVSTNSSAVLRLEPTNATAPVLAADFHVEAGTLDVQNTVNTTGDLFFTGGKITVRASEAIQFRTPT